MKRNRRRLPVPQHEFGFTPATFNLIVETGIDGERIARERAEADHARHNAETAQEALFTAAKERTALALSVKVPATAPARYEKF